MNLYLFQLFVCIVCLGTIASGNQLQFHIALRHDPQALEIATILANEISDPYSTSRYFTSKEITSIFTTPVIQKRSMKVKEWLELNGLISYCEDWGDSFFCTAPQNKIESAFGVQVSKVGSHYRVNKKLDIPQLLDEIQFIEGLSTKYSNYHKHQFKSTTRTDYVGREVVERMYNVTFDVINTSYPLVGVVEFDGAGFQQSGVEKIETDNGLPSHSVKCQYGPNNSGDVESELDLQMIGMTVSGAALCYINYDQNLWIYHMFSHLAQWENTPPVISVSYGWAEWDQCEIVNCGNETAEEYVNRANMEALKLVLRGVSVIVSSGDAGSPGRTNEGCDNAQHRINPVYPGSSPWVTSVGATFILPKPTIVTNYTTFFCQEFGCSNGTLTQTISQDQVGWTTGGGFGVYSSESQATWQGCVVNEYLNSGVNLPNSSDWNPNGRGYPDLTDNCHNCPVWDAYCSGYCPVDGTSCSSPLFAAKLALLNSHRLSQGKRSIGFANPLLYLMAQESNSIFSQPHNVTNTWCTEYTCCGQGYGFVGPPEPTTWNPVAGLGQINFGEAVAFLDALS